MSKKKKTIEELLKEALVPEDEQSFQVPENWVWVRTETTNGIVTGSTPAKKQSEYYGGDFPFVKPADLEQGNEVIHASEYLTEKGKAVSRIIPKESTMVCCIGSIGKAGFSTVECTTNQQINSLVPNKKMINPKFNYYQVLNGTYQNELWNRSSATTVSIINKGKMSLIPYVLPPLNEQKRIADKVELLLNKIEEAKQLIEEAKETFKLRRAAIIRTILEEELSNDKLPRGWRNIKVKDLFTIFGGGTPSKAKEEYWNGRIPWISAKDMKTTFISETIDYITEKGLKNSSAKLAKRGSVVMVVRSGILQRTLPVAFLVSECTVNQDLKVFDSGDELINKYFLWYVKGNEKNLLHSYSKSGTTVNSIEFEKFKSHEILLPPMDVLKQKIDKIETVIQKEKSANRMLNLADSIDELKSSILSKAFRGELGTNEPNDENAIELLKEVLQEQVK
ncbi:restriction endonuclease subunit S [Bacillus badius]|uniref:restriction endonuclease subunit S n=1 Tax=Bacillus badius TaxID=1455 RepID=UPI001CBACC7B|nr:restriction endonuclease subunit S [Bacillus badius]UAT32231.1 restriction endonuclease subunit S [Bacillus badius]